MEMISHRVVVDLAERAFLGADAAGEVAEVVDSKRQVGGGRLADRLAVVPSLDEGELVEIVFNDLGDAHQDLAALAGAGAAPGILRGMCRIEREFDIILVGPSHFADDPTIDRGGVLEVAAVDGRHPFATDKVLVAFGEGGCLQQAAWCQLVHLFSLPGAFVVCADI